jgi:hypothetical protein
VQELFVSSEAADIPDEHATAAEAVAEESPDTGNSIISLDSIYAQLTNLLSY